MLSDSAWTHAESTYRTIHIYPVTRTTTATYYLRVPTSAYYIQANTARPRIVHIEQKRVSIKRLPRKRFSTSVRVGVHG